MVYGYGYGYGYGYHLKHSNQSRERQSGDMEVFMYVRDERKGRIYASDSGAKR
jgi:hypothetical protein